MAGKVMRLNADGTVPSDNPRAGSPIIGYGIRNSFGFTFDPQNGHLWRPKTARNATTRSTSSPRLKLTNFGWGPSQTCSSPPPAPRNTNQDGPSPVLPKLNFPYPPALTGAAFCDQCGLSSAGQLFFGDFNTGKIHRATLTSDRTGDRLAGAVLRPLRRSALARDAARRRPDLLQHEDEHLPAEPLTCGGTARRG